MTNGSLMKVESIAECSPWSILKYFDLHYAIISFENQFLCLFESERFTQVLLYMKRISWLRLSLQNGNNVD